MWVVRPDAREHRPDAVRHEDAALRGDHGRARGLLRRAPAVGTWPGGIHLEFTGEDVTECLGGSEAVLRGAARPPLRDALRPAPERAPVARSRLPRRRAHALGVRPARRAPRRRRDGPDRGLGGARRAPRRRVRSRRRAGTRTPPSLELAVERGAVEPAASLAEALRGRGPRARRRPGRRAAGRRSRRARRRPAGVHRHGRRLDEGRRLRRGRRRPALRRRPPDLRRGGARARAARARISSRARRGS